MILCWDCLIFCLPDVEMKGGFACWLSPLDRYPWTWQIRLLFCYQLIKGVCLPCTSVKTLILLFLISIASHAAAAFTVKIFWGLSCIAVLYCWSGEIRQCLSSVWSNFTWVAFFQHFFAIWSLVPYLKQTISMLYLSRSGGLVSETGNHCPSTLTFHHLVTWLGCSHPFCFCKTS